jgi:hypothetical protein
MSGLGSWTYTNEHNVSFASLGLIKTEKNWPVSTNKLSSPEQYYCTQKTGAEQLGQYRTVFWVVFGHASTCTDAMETGILARLELASYYGTISFFVDYDSMHVAGRMSWHKGGGCQFPLMQAGSLYNLCE